MKQQTVYTQMPSGRLRLVPSTRRYYRGGTSRRGDLTVVRSAPASKMFVKRAIKRAQNQAHEMHHHNVYTNGQEMSTTVYIADLCSISQGDADTERVGDKIRPKAFSGFLRFKHDDASETNDTCRVIIFQWKDDSTPTAWTDLFHDGTTSSLRAITSPYSMDKKRLFKVLYDSGPINFEPNNRTYYDGATVQNQDNSVASIKWKRISVSDKKLLDSIQYQAGTTTGVNKVYMMALGQRDADTSNTNIDYYFRLKFHDA